MECFLDNKTDPVLFLYHFDQDDSLSKITMKNHQTEIEKIIFDRQLELETAVGSFISEQQLKVVEKTS